MPPDDGRGSPSQQISLIVLPLNICPIRENLWKLRSSQECKEASTLEKVLILRGLRGFAVNLFGCGWKQRHGRLPYKISAVVIAMITGWL